MRHQLISSLLTFGVIQNFNQKFRFRQFYARLLKMHRIRTGFSRYFIPTLLPSFLIVKAVSKSEDLIHQKIATEADYMYEAGKFDELLNHLKDHQTCDSAEILWRLARAIFEKCRSIKDSKEKLQYLEEALELVDRSLKKNEQSSQAHKWRAILLDYVWREKSTKGRILHSFEVKKHMERAVFLDPRDGTSYYLLGEWCFTFADMPWYQRKLASTLFASPPTSTYKEAIRWFLKAEIVSPNFYSMNLLMIGKCFLRLDNKIKAIEYLKRAYEYPAKTADDLKAMEEAEDLLKQLKAL